MVKLVSWNIDTMPEPWRELVEMDADVALLQEVGSVPEDVLDRVELSPHIPWLSHDPTTGYPHYDRWPMVVRLSDRVRVEWFRQIGPTWVARERSGDVAVSGIGIIDVAKIIPKRVSKKHWSELTALASGQSWRRRSMLLSSAAIPRSPCSVFGTDPAMRTSARQPNDEEVPQRCVDRMDAVPVPSPIHTRS